MDRPTASTAVRSTYRNLRLGVVVLLLLLLTAVVAEAVRAGCWLPSLSAYYWTGAHDAVVGALCAVGALLVAYTGVDDLEDALLDVAGFLALVVAFTPTQQEPGCTQAATVERLADPRTALTALAVAGLLAVGTRTVVALRGGRPWTVALARSAAAGVVLAVGVGLVAAPDVLVATAHDTAAVLLFVAVVGVVALRAFRTDARPWRVLYACLGAAMLVTLSAVVAVDALVPAWGQAVLVLETALVGLFAVSWLVQTVERWHEADPA